jgi:hypothetical protein
MIWRPWKHGPQRYGKLRQRGVGKALAAQTAGRPHGPWRVAYSPALGIALPLAYFDSPGLPQRFDSLAQPSEPPDADSQVVCYGRGAGDRSPPMPTNSVGVCDQSKVNMSNRSLIAGLFSGTYGLSFMVLGLGKLSRLRWLTGGKFQLRSMNFSRETWSEYS